MSTAAQRLAKAEEEGDRYRDALSRIALITGVFYGPNNRKPTTTEMLEEAVAIAREAIGA